MTDYAAANEDIWPSQNDVAQTAGNGKKLLENQWQEAMAALAAASFVYTGGVLPASSANLNIDVPACQAMISGRFVDIPGSTTITAAASATNHVFLKLLRDGANLVTGAAFEVNTTGTPPSDSVKIGTLVASGSAITSTTDARSFAFINQARIVKPSIGTPELKTATGSATATTSGFPANEATAVTMNDYSFFPSLTWTGDAAGNMQLEGKEVADPSNTIACLRMRLISSGSNVTGTVRWRYMTASDNPEMWVAYDPATGQIRASWFSDDPTPDGQPGVQVLGCQSLRLTARDLEQCADLSATADEAQAYIKERRLRMQHHAVRALQLLSNDPAPSRWLLENCSLDLGTGKLQQMAIRPAGPGSLRIAKIP